MDPATAFGLACNVVQVVIWGSQTVGVIHDVYKNGATDKSKVALENANRDAELSNHLTASLKGRHASTLPWQEKHLLLVALDCEKVGNELASFLKQLQAPASATRTDKLVTAIKVITKSGKIKELEAKLDDCRSRLGIGMLASLW